MRQSSFRRAGASLLLALALAACNRAPAPTPGTASSPDWREENIYFALTDRFANGNPANDGVGGRAGDVADPSNPVGWHGGDLAGIRQKIEQGYFKKMGFTAIWISPVVLQVPAIPVAGGPNQGKLFAGYHGYWADDFFETEPHFGSLDDLKSLVDAAHANGLKIIQDVVVNHAGYDSALVKQHPDWFHTGADCDASANKDQDCALAGLPDFKQNVPAVRDYLNSFIDYWVKETKVDGLRMDTMKHVDDSYWTQFFAAGGPGDPKKVWTVGEVFNGDPSFLAKYLDTLGSPSVFDFPLYFAIKDNLSSAGGSLDAIANVFARDTAYNDPSRLTTFVDNHDVKRFVSEALSRGVSEVGARERLDLALSLIYTSRGTPSVYYGSEIGMAGGGDPYDYPIGGSNREDMDFSKVDASPLTARLKALADARARYAALTRGTQQELWRPNGGAPVYAFRRVTGEKLAGRTSDPVVAVMNGGDTALDLSMLPGGGIGLLGTFAGGTLTEVTGHASDLRVVDGKLVGTVPARTLLAVSGAAGAGGGTVTNPALPDPANVAATPGDGAVKLTWTAPTGTGVTGFRVYQRRAGQSAFTQLNFAPLPTSVTTFFARGLTNDAAYDFRVVSVDASGAESPGATVSATPSAANTTKVTFTVDAVTQGNGVIELRRFDTGAQLEYPMQQVSRGVWKTSVDLPLFREIKFKFGNDAATARNSGYEGPGQGDRSFTVDVNGAYEGTYDFIEKPVPAGVVTGSVTGAGAALGNASVVSSVTPELNYALTFADGTYVLRTDAGARTLTASAPGFTSAQQTVTAPATGVNFNLAQQTDKKYVIDGSLSDWTGVTAFTSPDEGVFGADNNWKTLRVDGDDKYLYLAYEYRVSGNSAIAYLDFKAGGITSALGLDAWTRRATFPSGAAVDAFVARYENQSPQLRLVSSGSTATTLVNLPEGSFAAGGTLPEQTVELAIPWTALGLSGKPANVGVYGGIFGGDNYGAGDIVPNATSTPSASGNTIGTDGEQRAATFATPYVKSFAP
ncbi:alpha-amylase family glycosyl hydrolase [Deinococcus pimensis]|uniref:alpha-amylase family glycosyl hydrolase n=1 Tax=Deinococcus pimensis TaxID=309888 RepID=UPI000485FD86|nr:alpha-amylase family glycosyl hydrolase [Deinococcus pimensis]